MKDARTYPEIARHPWRDQYFGRAVVWDWNTEQKLDVHAPDTGANLVFDDWEQLVFAEADGGRTVSGLVDWLVARDLDFRSVYELKPTTTAR